MVDACVPATHGSGGDAERQLRHRQTHLHTTMSSIKHPAIGEPGPSNYYEKFLEASTSSGRRAEDASRKAKKKKKRTRLACAREQSLVRDSNGAIAGLESYLGRRETRIALLRVESERLSAEAARLDERRRQLGAEAGCLEAAGLRVYTDTLARLAEDPMKAQIVGDDVLRLQREAVRLEAALGSWEKECGRLEREAARVEAELGQLNRADTEHTALVSAIASPNS
jgi:hypothetical protein